ncbi:hypothetical protein GCM10009799_45520 [Nocardiopsis rhodophaea]|uniref:Putative restriction endonuclease domain-containing protein n=1 Tax=Nocardiopsis rhodophaea TaxID=280238 RepID=A0ABP5F3Y2_9ACTN
MSVTMSEPDTRSAADPEVDPEGHEPPPSTEASPQYESMRELAERVAETLPDGYRVEILGGSLIVSPTPTRKHNAAIRKIMLQLEQQLPEELVSHQVTSIGHVDAEDSAIPDLVVYPAEAEDDDEWLTPPDIVEFALEVVSKNNSTTDTDAKPRVYAGWNIPIYLILDPRDGTIVLYADPREGEYRSVHRMKFGDVVKLPEPLNDIRLETEGIARYQ